MAAKSLRCVQRLARKSLDVNWNADGRTAFQLYIYDIRICTYIHGTAQRQPDTPAWVTGWQTVGKLKEFVQTGEGALKWNSCDRQHVSTEILYRPF